jgi:hypothetical protein
MAILSAIVHGSRGLTELRGRASRSVGAPVGRAVAGSSGGRHCRQMYPDSGRAPGLENGLSTPGRFSASVRQHAVLRVFAKDGIRPSSSAGGPGRARPAPPRIAWVVKQNRASIPHPACGPRRHHPGASQRKLGTFELRRRRAPASFRHRAEGQLEREMRRG